MIPDEQLDRHGHLAQHVGKMGECFWFAPVGQVASYDHHFRVVVMGVDIRYRGSERDRRIQPVEPFAGRYEMGIGQMDKFHQLVSPWIGGRGRGRPLPTLRILYLRGSRLVTSSTISSCSSFMSSCSPMTICSILS